VRAQQPRRLSSHLRITGAAALEPLAARRLRLLQCGQKEFLGFRVENSWRGRARIARHPAGQFQRASHVSPFSSAKSQVRAKSHQRFAVVNEMSIASAASSIVRPAK
jgi:hypothetical protein